MASLSVGGARELRVRGVLLSRKSWAGMDDEYETMRAAAWERPAAQTAKTRGASPTLRRAGSCSAGLIGHYEWAK